MTKLDEFHAAEKQSPAKANRLLFSWLSDDEARADLYRCLRDDSGGVLKFQSRASAKEPRSQDIDSVFHQDAYLLVTGKDLQGALEESEEFSSSPYRALGSGTFMLGLDKDNVDRQQQRAFALKYLRYEPRIIDAVASVAFDAAAVLPSKQREFDLAEVSEQVALRFLGFLFGFEQADHVLLEKTMRLAYLGANFQILGRHFLSEPGDVQEASLGMGALLERVAHLIDLYRARIGQAEHDAFERIGLELEELREEMGKSMGSAPPAFEPVLRRIADGALPDVKGDYSGNELAVIVVGLIAGSVGNIQAGACIAIHAFLRDGGRFESARNEAVNWQMGETKRPPPNDLNWEALRAPLNDLIWEALRLNPPVPFLPRRTKQPVTLGSTVIPEGRNVILAIGGATRDERYYPHHPDDFMERRPKIRDRLIFGGNDDPKAASLHQCVGEHLAMPVIARIVRGVITLNGLAETLDPRTGTLRRLEKDWGVMCREYPLEFNQTDVLTQFPLIVIMKVKTPVSEHAEALKEIIKYGAPKIEKKLRDAGHVHFAWFLFLENDTKLMMATIYDRDFDPYIEYFALEIGSMFDMVFEHIEDPPPMPVSEFPKEFVDTIRRYNNRAAVGYLFSAYPKATVSKITQQFPPEGP